MKLIDTHCHLNFKDFSEDADEVIKKTLREEVGVMIVGSQYSTSRRAIEYAEKYEDGVWAVVGLHPVHLGSEQRAVNSEQYTEKFDYGKYLELAKNEKVVAIGEVGLDYHHFVNPTNPQIDYKSTNDVDGVASENDEGGAEQEVGSLEAAKKEVRRIIELQKSIFKEFVKLADEVGKPLVIHGWNADKKDKELVGGAVAYEDILKIVHSSRSMVSRFAEATRDEHGLRNSLRNGNFKTPYPPFRERGDDSLYPTFAGYSIGGRRGVVHSFIGNYKMALRFVEQGFMIGLNGIITYSESYDRLIKEIGLENIILETDAPYLTPNPLERYSRNEPLNVKLVAQKIADVLGVSMEEVAEVTTKNARELFGI